MLVDIIKLGEEKDEEAKKNALLYLEDSLKHKDEFIQRTLDNLADNVSKEELGTALKDSFFKSYVLRLALQGKKVIKNIQKQ